MSELGVDLDAGYPSKYATIILAAERLKNNNHTGFNLDEDDMAGVIQDALDSSFELRLAETGLDNRLILGEPEMEFITEGRGIERKTQAAMHISGHQSRARAFGLGRREAEFDINYTFYNKDGGGISALPERSSTPNEIAPEIVEMFSGTNIEKTISEIVEEQLSSMGTQVKVLTMRINEDGLEVRVQREYPVGNLNQVEPEITEMEAEKIIPEDVQIGFEEGQLPVEDEKSPEVTKSVEAYHTELARLEKELYEQLEAVVEDAGDWNLVQDTGEKLEAHKAMSPDEYGKSKVPTRTTPVEVKKPVEPSPIEPAKKEDVEKLAVCTPDEIRDGAEFAELISSKEGNDVRYILIWGKDGKLYFEETDREGTRYSRLETKKVKSYINLDDLNRYVDRNLQSFAGNKKNDNLTIQRHLPIFRNLTIEETLERDRLEFEKSDVDKKHKTYSAKDNTPLTKDISALRHRHKGRKQALEKIESERGYDSLEITRSTLDDLLDAEANYNEFNKSPIHANDPKRQSVFGPSVTERRRKYAKLLDSTIEKHRTSLLAAFMEIDQGMDGRKWSNDEDQLMYLENQSKKTELFQERLRKDKFEKLSPEEKVVALKQFDKLLKERVNILGVRTSKEIEIEKEQNRQKRIETEKLKIEKNRNKKSQQTRKEQVANLVPELVVNTTARSPVSIETGNVKFESKVKVPQEIIEASRANISGKVATEVDRFFITPHADRLVLQFVENGQVIYHFVRIRRPNRNGEGQYELRYFELTEDGQIKSDPKKDVNPLNEDGVDGAFLRAYEYFQRRQNEGSITALGLVDLGEVFIKRLAELNNKLVEQNRQRL